MWMYWLCISTPPPAHLTMHLCALQPIEEPESRRWTLAAMVLFSILSQMQNDPYLWSSETTHQLLTPLQGSVQAVQVAISVAKTATTNSFVTWTVFQVPPVHFGAYCSVLEVCCHLTNQIAGARCMEHYTSVQGVSWKAFKSLTVPQALHWKGKLQLIVTDNLNSPAATTGPNWLSCIPLHALRLSQ